MTEIPDDATVPADVGELRRRLERLGQPWNALPHLTDEDPLPDPPRGGQPVEPGHVQGLRAVDSQEDFEAVLAEAPPGNPFLAARWRELGFSPGDGTSDGPAVQSPAAEGDVPEWGVG